MCVCVCVDRAQRAILVVAVVVLVAAVGSRQRLLNVFFIIRNLSPKLEIGLLGWLADWLVLAKQGLRQKQPESLHFFLLLSFFCSECRYIK